MRTFERKQARQQPSYEAAKLSTAAAAAVHQPHLLHQLQRTIGNQAVLRLLRNAASPAESAKNGRSGFGRTEAPLNVREVLRSPGQPLDAATRAFMETRFGQDFSQVRVHTDSHAERSASAIHARAYTFGQDVVFGAGAYAPGTTDGDRLLAHELAHTTQEASVIRRSPPKDAQTQTPTSDAAPDESAPSPEDVQLLRDLGYAKPEFAARYFLSNNESDTIEKIKERDALKSLVVTLKQMRQVTIEIQNAARDQLNEIRKNDIWPNWGTLNHVLTVAGTLASCYEGACLIGVVTGAISFFDTDTGAAASVATSCFPDPRKPGCAAAVIGGAGSMVADRKDQKAQTVRLSEKEEAKLMLEKGLAAQAIIDGLLQKTKETQDEVDDKILYLKKVYEYSRWGHEEDNPLSQRYKSGVLL
jgi:hypothetical protein